MVGAVPINAVEEAIQQLSLGRPELGLQTVGLSEASSLARVAASTRVLERWLGDAATLAAGIDRRTAAAYLMSILVWRLGEVLAHLYLEGAPTLQLDATNVLAGLRVTGHGRARDIGFQFLLVGGKPTAPLQREIFVSSVLAVHRPLVDALSQQTGLSRHALWRLVTDGMTNGFLVWGKLTGRLDFAMLEAAAVVRQEPLHNRQWQFVEAIGTSGSREWFRLRGGCCRLYKTEGNEYCVTCVLRDRQDQMQRLSARL